MAEDGKLHISGVTETILVVRNRTDEADLGEINFNWKELKKRHEKDYKAYFDRVSLYLGATPDSIKALPTDVQLKRYADGEANPELEALYFQYGRYLLIASSRTEGVPANLQGLWNESMEPPWSSNYTTDINLEENCWPAEVEGPSHRRHRHVATYKHHLYIGHPEQRPGDVFPALRDVLPHPLRTGADAALPGEKPVQDCR